MIYSFMGNAFWKGSQEASASAIHLHHRETKENHVGRREGDKEFSGSPSFCDL